MIKREDKRLLFYQMLMGIVFAIGSLFSWYVFRDASKLADKILGTVVFTFMISITLMIFLNPLKGLPIFKQLFSVIGWVIGAIFTLAVSFQVLFGPALVFIMVAGIQIVVWKLISWAFGLGESPGVIAAYLISLVTIVIFSYKGVTIINIFNRYFLSEDGEIHKTTNRLMLTVFSAFHFRRRIYEITTVLYILSSIETLSNKVLVNSSLWLSYSKASLAILLTFISIDRYVNSFMPNVIKHERHQLGKLVRNDHNETV